MAREIFQLSSPIAATDESVMMTAALCGTHHGVHAMHMVWLCECPQAGIDITTIRAALAPNGPLATVKFSAAVIAAVRAADDGKRVFEGELIP
jgi:hypothetical protein